MTVKEKLENFQRRFEKDRVIVLLNKRSELLKWFWLRDYGPKRHQIKIKDEWKNSEVNEEKHYMKNGEDCISLEI